MILQALLLIKSAIAQFNPNGPTQPGLPPGCLGSFPDIPTCVASNWHITAPDPCAPLGSLPIAGQQVYIKDAQNFCINLPNPHSIFLQNNYYSNGKFPTVVQAEGYVQSFCLGSYLPPGSLAIAPGGITSAHVLKTRSPAGDVYYQVYGRLDCDALHINCQASSPDAFDDGGQYDNGPYVSCGKEPYSGVDSSPSGNPGYVNYVEMAGDGIFCMRVCKDGTQVPGGSCDVTQDTKGCGAFMGITNFDSGFSFTDLVGDEGSNSVTVTASKTSTASTSTSTTTSSTTTNATSSTNTKSAATTTTSDAYETTAFVPASTATTITGGPGVSVNAAVTVSSLECIFYFMTALII